MPIILLSIKNPKEAVAIKQFLLKSNIQVVSCLINYSSYIKALHYEPDLVLSEFSESTRKEYFNFLKMKNDNHLIKNVPYICYGEECNPETIEALKSAGIPIYLKRPLNNAVLLAIITKICSIKTKGEPSLDIKKNVLPNDDDCKRLRDKLVHPDEKIAILRNRITKMLAFPVTIANILRVTQNEKSGAGDLATITKTDPAVTAEILRAANSAFFKRGGGRIVGIKDAIVRIGFMESRKLALSLSVFKIAQQKNHETGFNHTEFWFHSLAVAIIAERIARNSMLANPEEAFIGGLLHDIGLLLLNEYFNPIFMEILEQSLNEGYQFIRCEAITLGITHNLLVKALFTEWNFPQILINSVPFFSRIDMLTRENVIKCPLAIIISISEIIARGLSIGHDADCCIVPIPSQVFHMLKLPYGIQKAFIENAYTTVNRYNQVLKIDDRTYPEVNKANTPLEQKFLFFSFSEEVYNPVYEYYFNKQYNITAVRTIEDFNAKASECNIIILNEATSIHKDFIQNCKKINKTSEIITEKLENENSSASEISGDIPIEVRTESKEKQPESVPVKIILLSKDPVYGTDEFNTENIISISYPVDLRVMDGIISCYSSNISPQELLNRKNESVNTSPEINEGIASPTEGLQNILLAHSNDNYRLRLKKVISNIAGLSVTEIDPFSNAQNLSEITKQTYKAIFLEYRSTDQILKTVDIFKRNPSSRPQFVITFNTVKKEDLLPLITSGITLFLSENDDDESIEKRVFSILTATVRT